MKSVNQPVAFLHGDENCFNIAYGIASEHANLRLQAGVFLAFDHKNKYWDSWYMNHYWCITQDYKIVDCTRHLWQKFASHLDFEIQIPKDPKILVISDAYKQLKLIETLQSLDQMVVGPYRHSHAFGESDLVYLPGFFFEQSQIPEFVIEKMKSPGYFTIEDVDNNNALMYGGS